MIIELFGLPASGKTTLAQELNRQLGYRIIKSENRFSIILSNLIFIFRYPFIFFYNFWLIIRNAYSIKLWHYKILNCWLYNNYKTIISRKLEKVVIDQGLWQNILSIFERNEEQEFLRRYIKRLPLPDLLVIFDLDEENWQQRISKRGYFARQQFDKNKVEVWRKAMLHNLKVVKRLLSEAGVSYLILDSKMTLPEQLALIKEKEKK